MDTCLSIFYLKEPKSTTTTAHATDTALCRWASNTRPPNQTADMTPTTPTLQ